MPLGEILARKNLLTPEQLSRAVQRQNTVGGLLGDNLVALGYVQQEALNAFLQEPPQIPKAIEDTGLDKQLLSDLLLKAAYLQGLETAADLSGQLRLPQVVIDTLLNQLRKQGLAEVRGSVQSTLPVIRYGLTTAGKNRASEAISLCGYTGPAPVPYAHYVEQVERQSITHERIDPARLARALSHLVLDQELLRRLGPAVNSGKAILMYGPPGNGKTSVSESIGRAFAQTIYIPHCIEVDGQIIKIFDETVHRPVPDENSGNSLLRNRCGSYDQRWVRCRRPVIITGGELTLEMLDLDFDRISKYYEAPLQVKATGGIFIIDDFGRQMVQPRDLLNRWIIPLEKRVDYLSIHTGKKFELPFDELVIFSTNIPPQEMMDAAQLRRVHYKIRLDPPLTHHYIEIFSQVCAAFKLDMPGPVLSFLMEEFYPETGLPLAAFHPKFIVEQVIASCNYHGIPRAITLELVHEALANLTVSDSAPGPSGSLQVLESRLRSDQR